MTPWPFLAIWLAGLLALGVVVCAPAHAQQAAFVAGRSLDPRLYRPPGDGSALIGLFGSEAPPRGQLVASLGLDAAAHVLRLGRDPRVPSSLARHDHPLIDHALGAVLGVHAGLLPRGASAASLGVALPLLVQSGQAYVVDGSYNAARPLPLRSQGLGAPALIAKWSPWAAGGLSQRATGLSLLASAEFDIGGALRSDPDLALWPRVVLQHRPPQLRGALDLVVNVGYRFVAGRGPDLRPAGARNTLRYNDLLTAGAGASARLASSLGLLAELEVHQIAAALGEGGALAAELRGGVRVELAETRLTLAAGTGLAGGFSEADARVMASVAFVAPRRDSDGDGLRDAHDGCPHAREDFDLHRDGDGCPEPDDDGDGVPDARDECPALRGQEAAGGCPRKPIGDRDGDGVDDYRDDCPQRPAPGGCPLAAAGDRSLEARHG